MTLRVDLLVEAGEDAMADLGLHPREGETYDEAALRLERWVHWAGDDPTFDRAAARDLRVVLGWAPEPGDWTGFAFR